MMHDEKRRLNIAFLTSEDPNDRTAWSGLTYHMAQALQNYCGNVSYLGPIGSIENRIAITLREVTRYYLKKNILRERLLLVARKHSKIAAQRLATHRQAGRSFDVIFAPIGTAEIAFLETDIPIVLAEGTTFNSMYNYYPACSNMPSWSVREAYIVQDRAYKKAQAFIYPSEWAAHSAIRDCHVSEQKVHVVPHGANFEGIPSKDVILAKKKSAKCRLLFVGREWERKGGDIAFETLLQLEELGIQAELTVCGDKPSETARHESMNVIPFALDKNDEKQRKRLEQLYLQSDFLLVPTRQEIFGIVFCEASAFGLPSITTDTGGVSGAVQDGKNGFRLPYSSGGREYAKLIADIYRDDQRYTELVRSTRETFDERLNWDVWGATVRKILLNVISLVEA